MSNTIWLRHTDKAPADNYHKYLTAQRALINGDLSMIPSDKRDRTIAALKAKNEHFLRLREVDSANVQDDKFLTSFSVQYANPEFIGTILMPRAPVPHISGLYVKYDESARMGVVEDRITGRNGANEIEDGERLQLPYNCEPHALKNHLDWVTMENQAAPLNEMLDLTIALNDQSGINREKRISDVMTTSGNYASSNVITIGASDRFDSAGGGEPLKVILDMKSKLWMGRGPARTYFWCAEEIWNVLARHPQILDICKYTQGGILRPQSFGDYFGFDGVLVGKARYRTSNRGQTATYSRFWGNNMGCVRVAITPSVRQATFGYTMTWRQGNSEMGDRMRVWWDNKLYTDGGYTAQCANHEDYKVVANKAGVLVQTPIDSSNFS